MRAFLRRFGEAVADATAASLARPGSLIGHALAAALGIGVFVALTSLGATAERQLAADFDALRAIEVRVTGEGPDWVPDDYEERLRALAGVVEVEKLGIYEDVEIATLPPHGLGRSTIWQAALFGVDPGGPKAIRAVVEGANLDASVLLFSSGQVLLGSRLANRLEVGPLDGVQAVWIEERPYLIRGIIEDVGRHGRILDGVVMLHDHAAQVGRHMNELDIAIETAPGAAASVASQAPLALRPDRPESVAAVAPPDPGQFRVQIEDRVRTSLAAVAVVAALVGAIVIANAMTMAVVARRGEIGLRRALGANGVDIFLQFITEAAIVGIAGGLVGASVGIVGSVIAAQQLGWNPVLEPSVPILGVAAGAVIGVMAGLVPAYRATRLQPVEALRQGE